MTFTARAWKSEDYSVSNNAPYTTGTSTMAHALIYGTTTAGSSSARNPALLRVHDKLDLVAALPEDWDGYGSARPQSAAVSFARQFLESAYDTVRATANAVWKEPHVSASESGEVVFEWWNGNKKLTTYNSPQGATFIKSWGPNMYNEMADGDLEQARFLVLWAWLNP